MNAVCFPHALLPDGWARDVRVLVDDAGAITDVVADADEGHPDEVVEGVAVPGVPNVHSHAFQRAMAGRAERRVGADDFWSWRKTMYRFSSLLEPEDVGAVAAWLYAEMLREGFTAVGEFHYLRNRADGSAYEPATAMADELVAAARRAGIGLTLLPTLFRRSDFGTPASPAQARFVTSVEALLGDVGTLHAGLRDRDVRIGLALHSLRAVPPADLEEGLSRLAEIDATAPVHIHVAEQVREVEACVAATGARPVAWLLDHAPVGPRWCLVHATHVSAPEVVALARSGAVVGLCPTTEANLGDGIFPLVELAREGGLWAVGSDSHVQRSPAAELRLLEYGQRLTRLGRNVLADAHVSSGRTLLEAAWNGGARACGRALGRLEAGCRADIVVLDPAHPDLAGGHEDGWLDGWIFSGDSTPVRDVMVGGRWRVRGGRHVEHDALLEAYARVAARLADAGSSSD